MMLKYFLFNLKSNGQAAMLWPRVCLVLRFDVIKTTTAKFKYQIQV